MLAGMRIEPPPSPACASGTMPDATAAPEPPLEPPGLRSTSHGFRVGPYAVGSVVGQQSELRAVRLADDHEARGLELGVEVRVVIGDVADLLQQPVAEVVRLVGERPVEILHHDRHAAERAVGRVSVASSRARSKRSWMTAFSAGLTLLDARDRGFDELDRCDLAVADQLRLRGRVDQRRVVVHRLDDGSVRSWDVRRSSVPSGCCCGDGSPTDLEPYAALNADPEVRGALPERP